MTYTVLALAAGHPRWTELVGGILADPVLVQQMWDDAEHEPDDFTNVTLSMVLADGVPAAWAGSVETVVDGQLTLKCTLNYERRGDGRDYGLYRMAYLHRHETCVRPSVLPQVTYLFGEVPAHDGDVIARHLASGWYLTGATAMSDDGHRWWELRREPTAT